MTSSSDCGSSSVAPLRLLISSQSMIAQFSKQDWLEGAKSGAVVRGKNKGDYARATINRTINHQPDTDEAGQEPERKLTNQTGRAYPPKISSINIPVEFRTNVTAMPKAFALGSGRTRLRNSRPKKIRQRLLFLVLLRKPDGKPETRNKANHQHAPGPVSLLVTREAR